SHLEALLQVEVRLFDFEITVEPPASQLAPDPALFDASPRRLGWCRLGVIHPHDTRTKSLDQAHGSKDVACPDRGRQTKWRIVGKLEGLFLAVEGRETGDGTENLFTRDPCRWIDIVENRRLRVETSIEIGPDRAAAADGQTPLLFPKFLISAHALEMLL